MSDLLPQTVEYIEYTSRLFEVHSLPHAWDFYLLEALEADQKLRKVPQPIDASPEIFPGTGVRLANIYSTGACCVDNKHGQTTLKHLKNS